MVYIYIIIMGLYITFQNAIFIKMHTIRSCPMELHFTIEQILAGCTKIICCLQLQQETQQQTWLQQTVCTCIGMNWSSHKNACTAVPHDIVLDQQIQTCVHNGRQEAKFTLLACYTQFVSVACYTQFALLACFTQFTLLDRYTQFTLLAC